MNHWIYVILIMCVFILYSWKGLDACENKIPWRKKLEIMACKALRFTFMGLIAMVLVSFALFAFPLIRKIGFAIFSDGMVELIRILLDIFLDTRSVFMSIEIIFSSLLIVVEFGIIFSIVSFFVVKRFIFLQRMCYDRIRKAPEIETHVEIAIPRTFRKIFLTYANLRI